MHNIYVDLLATSCNAFSLLFLTGDVRVDGRLRQHDAAELHRLRARRVHQLGPSLPAREERSRQGQCHPLYPLSPPALPPIYAQRHGDSSIFSSMNLYGKIFSTADKICCDGELFSTL